MTVTHAPHRPALASDIRTTAPALRPDPRTRILTLLVVNGLALGNNSFPVAVYAVALVCALLAAAGRLRAALTIGGVFLAFAALYGVSAFNGDGHLAGSAIAAGASVTGFWCARFTVAIGAGYWAVLTIRPVELICALHRLHAPRWLIVPLAVVLRIFPVIATECRAVMDAMTLRGIDRGARGILAHPLRSGELLLVPLLSTVVRSGDELAAAAMIRGLGGPHRPVGIVTPRFRAVDAALLVCLVGLVAVAVGGWAGPT